MQIIIKSKELNLHLFFPTALVFNSLTLGIFLRTLKKSVPRIQMNQKVTQNFVRELKRIKKRYGRLELVNVESAEGEKVIVRL